MAAEKFSGSEQSVQSSAESSIGISTVGTPILDGNQLECAGYLCNYRTYIYYILERTRKLYFIINSIDRSYHRD